MKHLPLRRRPALQPVALAALLLLNAAAHALPQDPRATFGRTQVTQTDARTLRIDQSSARAGIDWRSFSIGAGERVTIVQPDARSVLFNRVDGLDPSVVLGRLDANGRVFLTNPRGVIFGAGAQVDVGALVATTLSLSDADARAGRWWLQGEAGAAELRNDGRLRAADGTVALVAPQVHNGGTIEARRIALGAVGAARVDLDGDGRVLFATRPVDGARLDQLGTLVADGGRAELQAAARGQVAGSVLNLRGAVFARGLQQQGGEIVIDGGAHGIVEVGAALDASAAGGRGGQVTVLGDRVLLDGAARLDASGRDGGGAVRVGGDYQGANPALHNAARVAVREGALLDASATGRGDGGTVIVWSDEATRYAGHARVRGGAAGGDGGLVEVSGKQFLDYAGSADRLAPRGRAGRLLLDPVNLTIQPGSPDREGDGGGLDLDSLQLAFAAPGTNSVITGAAVEAQLAVGSVSLQASDTIDVFTSISSSSPNSLSLQAGRDIIVSGSIAVGGNLTLSANDAASPTRFANGAVSAFGSLSAGGRITLSNGGGSGVHQLAGDFTAATLAITGPAELQFSVPFNLSGSSTLAGVLSGSGGLVKNGIGTLTLTGSNT